MKSIDRKRIMQLESQATRDALNIDSFERAIVYAIHLLRYGYNDSGNDDSIRNRYRFSVNKVNARNGDGTYYAKGQLVIDAELEYEDEALQNGGDVLSNIIETLAGSVVYNGSTPSASTNIIAPITPDIAGIDSLEKYFYWSLLELQGAYGATPQQTPELLNRLTLNTNFKDLNQVKSTKIKAVIDFAYSVYLQTNNLINAVGFDDFIPEQQGIVQIANTVQIASSQQIRSSYSAS